MMFKLLLLLPIILGPKCLVYSTENNDTSTELTVETQSTVTSLLTQTPSALTGDSTSQQAEDAGQTPENSAEQTGAETTDVDAHQVPEGTTQPADEASGTVVVEESDKSAEEAAPESPDQASGTGGFQVVVVGSNNAAEASSEEVDQSAGETVVEEDEGTVVDEQANEVAVDPTETAAESAVEDQTADEAVVSEEVVQVAEEENVSAETTEVVAEETVVAEPVVAQENVVAEAVTEGVAEPVVPEPVPEPELPEVNGLKLVDLDIFNFMNNNHVNHRFDRKLNMHMFSVRSGHAFGFVKESFSKHELEYLAKDDLYKSLTQLKNNNLFHLHTDNMVNGTYRWKDTLVLLEHLKNGTLEAKLQEETLFVTVEVDKMESNTHVNYSFDNDNNVHVFAAKRPFIIDSVKLDGEFVWVYDDDKNDKKFPVSVEFNGSDMINLKFQKFYLTYTRNGSKKWNVQFDFYEQLSIEAPKEAEPEPEQVTAQEEAQPAESNEAMAQDQVDEGGDMTAVPVAEEPANEAEEVVEQQPANEDASMDADTVALPAAEAEEPVAEDQTETGPLVEGDQQPASEADQHMASEEAPKGEAEESVPVPEAQVETVAAPEPEPELLLDDHLVSAFEFVWRQNVAALEVAEPVYANYVYVRTKGDEKTVTIFFTDRSYIRLHRVGALGPWREWASRPRVTIAPSYPRIEDKKPEVLSLPKPVQLTHGYSSGIILRDKPVAERLHATTPYQPVRPAIQLGCQQGIRTGISAGTSGRRASTASNSGGYGGRRTSTFSKTEGKYGTDQQGQSSTPSTQQQSEVSTTAEADQTPEPVKLTGVELNIKDKKGTTKFTYNKSGNVVTFTAKDGFGFSSVKSKTTGCRSKEAQIWDAANETEYATKVVLNGKGNKKKSVTIHLANGSKKEFKKDKNNPWNEVPQPQETVSTADPNGQTVTAGQSAGADGTTSTSQPVSRRPSAASAGAPANEASTSRKNSTASAGSAGSRRDSTAGAS